MRNPERFQWAVDPSNRTLVIQGEMDLLAQEQQEHIKTTVMQMLAEQPAPKSLWIDASRVTFADSSGLNVIISLAKPYREMTGKTMRIKTNPALADMLTRLKVDDYFALEVVG